MSYDFLDRVAAAQRRPLPRFMAFRTRLVMNGEARRRYFGGTDRVLLAYDASSRRLAIKSLQPDVYEHQGWQAFHIEPRTQAKDSFQIEWLQFWDREVGFAGGKPIVCGEECLELQGQDILTISL